MGLEIFLDPCLLMGSSEGLGQFLHTEEACPQKPKNAPIYHFFSQNIKRKAYFIKLAQETARAMRSNQL